MASNVEEIELRMTTAGGDTVSRTLKGVQEDLSDVGEEAQEAGQEGAESMDRIGDAASETAQQVDRASERMDSTTSSMNRMGGASDNAAELLFSVGDTAQDARFGLRGMGNNLGFAAEQASVLVQQAGSGKAAINALTSAIAGPAGAVLALQGLIALGPEIIDFFQGSTSAAEDFNDAIEEQAGELFEITKEAGSFEAQTLEQAKQVRQELKGQKEEQQAFVQALDASTADFSRFLDDVQNVGATLSNELFGTDIETNQEVALEGAAQAAERLGLEVETVRQAIQGQADAMDTVEAAIKDQPELLPEAEQRLKVLRQSESTVDAQITQLKAAKRVSDAFADTSAERADEQERALAATEAEVEAMKTASLNVAQGIGDSIQSQVPDSVQGPDLQGALNDLKPQSIDAVNQTIGQLQRMLNSGTWGQAARDGIRATISDLRNMRAEMKRAGDRVLDIGPTLEKGFGNAIANVAKAAAQGENAAVALLKTLANLAQRIGKMMIGFGTAALGLRNLITNPTAAVAAGAALVALGAAAKSAISSEVENATGGGSSTGRPSTGGIDPSPEGTAPAGIPSFRTGVDDFGGGLAQVHRNEMVALPPSSNVITNENAKAIRGAMGVLSESGRPGGGGGTQSVDVRHETKHEVDIGDGFRLVERLNRIRSDRDDVVGGP